ncbi:MAG: hypothetical protein GY714_14525 [Desulfobacterales bacterium]|nr:hypothetical protein [Desulfobacterales bacterium]MCP4158518.1 hypothetical protein [Deltaproteobacteria bacterium]
MKPKMNQKIFSLNLSVETTSVYLACCGLTDENQTVSKSALISVWSSSVESLEKSLKELIKKNILVEQPGDDPVYLLTDEGSWV